MWKFLQYFHWRRCLTARKHRHQDTKCRNRKHSKRSETSLNTGGSTLSPVTEELQPTAGGRTGGWAAGRAGFDGKLMETSLGRQFITAPCQTAETRRREGDQKLYRESEYRFGDGA